MVAVKKADELYNKIKSDSPCAILLYGPDIGILEDIAANAAKLMQQTRKNAALVRLNEDEINKDFANFESLIMGGGLFGNLSIVQIRINGDAISSNIGALIKDIDSGNIRPEGGFILLSSKLTNRSKLAQAFDGGKSALTLRTFEPNRSDFANIIKSTAANMGVKIENDAIEEILNGTESDSNSIRAQVENLALYAGAGGTIDEAVVAALAINSASSGSDDLLNAAFMGKRKECIISLSRLLKDGASPVSLLNFVFRRISLLNTLTSEIIGGGQNASDIVKDKKYGVFWKEQENIARQCRIWRPNTLSKVLKEAVALDTQLKTTGLPHQDLLERFIIRICEFAAAKAKA